MLDLKMELSDAEAEIRELRGEVGRLTAALETIAALDPETGFMVLNEWRMNKIASEALSDD